MVESSDVAKKNQVEAAQNCLSERRRIGSRLKCRCGRPFSGLRWRQMGGGNGEVGGVVV